MTPVTPIRATYRFAFHTKAVRVRGSVAVKLYILLADSRGEIRVKLVDACMTEQHARALLTAIQRGTSVEITGVLTPEAHV